MMQRGRRDDEVRLRECVAAHSNALCSPRVLLTMHAIRVEKTGGPEVLHYVEVETPRPGPGQVLVHIEAIGVNFIDVYHRTGMYPLPLPLTPGSEAAGVVEETGAGVTEFKKGDRVAFAM